MNELEQLMAEVAACDDPDGAWFEELDERGEVSDEISEEWLKTGAEFEIVAAMINYGEYLEDHERLDEAERWYGAAADAGSAEAIYWCALREDEKGNSATSEELYREAAELLFLPAVYDLGRILYKRGDPSWRLCASICQQSGYVHWEELVGSGTAEE